MTVRAIEPGQVAYSIQLPVQSLSTVFAADWERAAGPAELVRVAKAADRWGFFSIGVCDHVAIPRARAEAMGTVWYDTVATLGLLAGITERVRLLSHIYVLPYRNPLLVAKSFATLDLLSEGRVILGVGAGHVADEFSALGVEFDKRGQLRDEAIDKVIEAWTEEFVEDIDVAVAPRAVQQPRPPVWVGGSTWAALRRAAERGDGWLPQGTPPSKMPEQVSYLLEHRRNTRGDEPIDISAGTPWIHVGTPAWEVSPRALTGSPDAIAEPLRKLAALGVNNLMLALAARSCDELEDQMEAFATAVAPLLA